MDRMIDRRTPDWAKEGVGVTISHLPFPFPISLGGTVVSFYVRLIEVSSGCAGPVDHHKLTITLILSLESGDGVSFWSFMALASCTN